MTILALAALANAGVIGIPQAHYGHAYAAQPEPFNVSILFLPHFETTSQKFSGDIVICIMVPFHHLASSTIRIQLRSPGRTHRRP